MIQDPYNPYGINRFPRIYRPRASSSAGILAGAGTQMVGPQPGGQPRGNGGGPPRGINRTTTGQGQPEEQQGLLGQALAGKEAYDQVNSAAKGGRNIRNYMSKPGGALEQGQDAVTGLSNMFGNSQALTNAAGREMVASPEIMKMLGGDTATVTGLKNAAYTMPADTAMQAHWATGSPDVIANAVTPQATINGTAVGGSGTQLSQTGGKAASGGTSGMGAAMSGLGMGLSAYDMAENGIDFGNATGLAGSAMLGASAGLMGAGTAAAVGAMNAWNPVGWALLAGSAAYSIFG